MSGSIFIVKYLPVGVFTLVINILVSSKHVCGNHPYPRIKAANYQQALDICFKLTQDLSRLDYSVDFHYGLKTFQL
jgi:hypothetical protein